jgi:hypothetical protein
MNNTQSTHQISEVHGDKAAHNLKFGFVNEQTSRSRQSSTAVPAP